MCMDARITRVFGRPLNAPLLHPFTIATGELTEVTNVAVGVEVDGGVIGWGECPVLPPVTRTNQSDALELLASLGQQIVGDSVNDWMSACERIRHIFHGHPSVSSALEMATVDAAARQLNTPLYALLGSQAGCLESDITIPICPPEGAKILASEYGRQGFTRIKTKIGRSIDADLARLDAIRLGCPSAQLILDANEGFSARESLELLDRLDQRGIRPILLEQPVPRTDWDGLRMVTQGTNVLVAADESCRSLADAQRICREASADVINIKLAKVGVLGALDIIALADEYDMKLMIGAMVESRLGCGFAAHLVCGRPRFEFVDLDTPHLLREDPIVGGLAFDGPRIQVDSTSRGHGMSLPS